MIRHVVVFRFTADALPDQREALLGELAGFPALFPQMRNWRMGLNESSRDDRFSHGFVVDFASVNELEGYLRSEHHETFVRERWRPIVDERAIVSFECDDVPL
jgi:hypothetical protein